MKEKFSHITDRLRMPIDEPIMETVVALNAVGITTTMSCGGHLEEGRRLVFPWVMVANKTSEFTSLIREASHMQEQADIVEDELKQLMQNDAESEVIRNEQQRKRNFYERSQELRHQARLLQGPIRQKLVQGMMQFYDGRIVSLDRHLIVTVIADGITRLRSQGGRGFLSGCSL